MAATWPGSSSAGRTDLNISSPWAWRSRTSAEPRRSGANVFLTANVPEMARRSRGPKRNPRAIGPTLAAEVSFRIAADKFLGVVLDEARRQAPSLAQGVRVELTQDSVAGVALLVRTLQLVQDVALGDFRSALGRIYRQEESRHSRDFAAAVRAAAGTDVAPLLAPQDV